MKKILFCLALMLAFVANGAYALDATTPEHQPNDMSFVQEKNKDARIGGGTLVKVRSGIPNLQFYGWIIKSEERRPGEYWVFLETAGGKFQVAAEGGHAPVDVTIEDSTPEQVYVVTITEPGAASAAAGPAATGDGIVHIDLPAQNGATHPGFNMVLVKNGRFVMGATPEQGKMADKDEAPSHRVLITKNYYIGQTEVTQTLWEFVMGENPSQVKDKTEELPVESVTWEECIEFCRRLSDMTGKTFRLPTEAEWEYAARGGHKGTQTIYAGSDNPDEVGWYEGTSNMRIMPVGTKKPNELGIYDMSGNVYEMCFDSKDKYEDREAHDPIVERGPQSERVRRGGSWDASSNSMRVSFRRRVPYEKDAHIHRTHGDTGLRIVMEE